MRCVYCYQEDTKVMETRESGTGLRRRRECPTCGKRFTTYERVEVQPLRVIKKDGSKEYFERDKLLHGFILACEKRPVTEEQIEEAVDDIISNIRREGLTEVNSKKIGEMAMRHLRKLDKVAYIRFASVYKQFKTVKGFEREIKILTGGS